MKALFSLSLLLAFALAGFAKDKYDVLGVWLIESKDAKVELYKTTNGQLEGKLVWLKDTHDDHGNPRTDIHNKNKELRTRPILGMTLAFGFEWNADKQQWDNGSVYVPGNGSTYCGAIKLKEDGTLYLRGYICGLRFLGKTSYCTRSTIDKTYSQAGP
jgi:uncharacterized protein (DUF2147 family)